MLLFVVNPVLLFGQQPDTLFSIKDSVRTPSDTSPAKIDSIQLRDSVMKKQADSIAHLKDSIASFLVKQRTDYITTVEGLLKQNAYVNWKGKPKAMPIHPKSQPRQDRIFYLLVIIAALLAFFRFFYTRYFNNLFRVFFNASLRQSQLTDQLLQAKLPSLFFNILFMLTGGVYVFLLLNYYHWITPGNFWLAVLYCGVSLGLIYFVKFLSLKFTGWVTGYKEITNTYVFIIFLINKILGILLLPFAIVIAFSTPQLATASVIISLLLIGLMFLLRFFRSYGLLQHQLKISRFHFLMYVVGIEVVPLLLIYKGLVLLLSKNL